MKKSFGVKKEINYPKSWIRGYLKKALDDSLGVYPAKESFMFSRMKYLFMITKRMQFVVVKLLKSTLQTLTIFVS